MRLTTLASVYQAALRYRRRISQPGRRQFGGGYGDSSARPWAPRGWNGGMCVYSGTCCRTHSSSARSFTLSSIRLIITMSANSMSKLKAIDR